AAFTGALSRATGENVGTYAINLGNLSAGSNYSLVLASTPVTFAITAKSVTGSFTAADEVYDGTTAATIASRALSGVVGTDDVTLSGGTATFADKNVGTGKTVTGTGFTLSGAAAGNYTLASSTLTAAASITAKTLTVSGITAGDKVYDGGTAATLNTSGAILNGGASGDQVSLVTSGAAGAFADKNVGQNKTVTISGLTLSGNDAGNYVLTQPTATA